MFQPDLEREFDSPRALEGTTSDLLTNGCVQADGGATLIESFTGQPAILGLQDSGKCKPAVARTEHVRVTFG